MTRADLLWFLAGAGLMLAVFLGAALLDRRRRERAKRQEEVFFPPPRESRRERHRVTVRLPADLLPEGGNGARHGTIVDLSPGGASVLLDRPVPAGTRLMLRFAAGGGASESVLAEVVGHDAAQWSRRAYLHCRFLMLTAQQERHLEALVAELERGKVK